MTDPGLPARRTLAALFLRWRTERDRAALSDLRRLAALYREEWRALPLDPRDREEATPGMARAA